MAEISEQDKKILDAFKALHNPPEINSPDDLVSFMKHFHEEDTETGNVKEEKDTTHTEDTGTIPKLIGLKNQFPRISLFYGESGKGEVTYPTWRYEIECLIEDGLYKEEQIALGIRRSVKGEAANILRRLGTKTNLSEIMCKFHSTFGDIDTKETILKKLYACTQETSESFLSYSSRLEELYAQACEIDAVTAGQVEILKNILYQGLRQPLKQMANYKFDTIADYDKFKMEIRKMENELKPTEKKSECHAMNQKQEPSELSEVKQLLLKMDERIQKLELEKEQSRNYAGYDNRSRGSYRDFGGNRGNFPRGYNNFGNRGQHRPYRPTGAQQFQPDRPSYPRYPPAATNKTCYRCKKEGHIARFCTETLNQLEQKYEEHPLVDAFNVYLQIFLSQALEPGFLSAIREADERFYLDSLENIDKAVGLRLTEIDQTVRWKDKFKESVKLRPHIREIDRPNLKQSCQACEFASQPAIKSVHLFGNPYDRFSLQESPPEGPHTPMEFMIGKTAAKYVKPYHNLYHFKYNLFKRCLAKVNILQDSKAGDNASILDQCLQNRTWVLQIFEDLKKMLEKG